MAFPQKGFTQVDGHEYVQDEKHFLIVFLPLDIKIIFSKVIFDELTEIDFADLLIGYLRQIAVELKHGICLIIFEQHNIAYWHMHRPTRAIDVIISQYLKLQFPDCNFCVIIETSF